MSDGTLSGTASCRSGVADLADHDFPEAIYLLIEPSDSRPRGWGNPFEKLLGECL